jgi:hypothetical protein
MEDDVTDKVMSVGPDAFKILPDGTVVVEHGDLKDFILKSHAQNVNLEVKDAFLEVMPTTA